MSSKDPRSISVIFPTLNDSHIVVRQALLARELLLSLVADFEVIVVNDGSTDDTRIKLDLMSAQYPEIKTIHHQKNLGYGGAVIAGFTHATKELVFYTDGDGQYDIKELKVLLDCLSKNVDLVNGFKLYRQDPWFRVMLGAIYQRIVKWLFGLKIRDVDCDFRLIRRAFLEKVPLKYKSGVFCVELIRRLQNAECRMIEVGVHHYPRLHGKSQFFRPKPVAWTTTQLFSACGELILLPMITKRISRHRSEIAAT